MKKVQVGIRFPTDVKAWLEDQARLNGSSQNSEVIRAVRTMMSAAGGNLGGAAPAASQVQRKMNHQEAHHHDAE